MSAVKSHILTTAATASALSVPLVAADALIGAAWWQGPTDEELRQIDADAAAVFIVTDEELAAIDAAIDAGEYDDDLTDDDRALIDAMLSDDLAALSDDDDN